MSEFCPACGDDADLHLSFEPREPHSIEVEIDVAASRICHFGTKVFFHE
jgi:hypothetical protein